MENSWGDLDLRLILDNLPTMVCALTTAGELEFVNRAVLEYFGKTVEELKRWDTIGSVHPEDLPHVTASLRGAVESAESHNTQQRLRRADGEYRWFQSRAHVVRDADGQIVRWLAVLTDIEDVKGDQAMARADLRTFISGVPMLAWSSDANGFVDFLNQRWLEYSGLSLEQALGVGWAVALHPDDSGGLISYWQSILISGQAGEYEARLKRFDGVYRWFLFRANPWRDESGRIVKWYGIVTDIEDRKQAEETLRENERNLRAIINSIPTPAWSTRPDGHVQFLNQRWLDYAGMTPEEALGWGWRTVIHPDDAGELLRQWELCRASGTAAEVEARHRRFDGVYRWFLVRANPLRDESGNVIKWCGTNIDIEDRKQADEALRASERNLRAIIDTIPTLSWSTRPDGYVEFLSERWLGFTGLTEQEAMGFGWAVAIHPEDAQRLLEYWQNALESGTDVDVEARLRRSDGAYRWFLFRASPLRDETGKIAKWYGTNIDIEDRKQAEESLRENERNLRAIINTIPTLSWSTRSDGYVEFLSERWLGFTGFTEEQALGFGWGVAIHPEDAPRLLQYWQNALDSGTEVDVEARLRRFDGTYRWFLFRASPLRDESGTIVKWYGTNIDIEDRKRADEALRESEVRLGRATQRATVGELAASIAHEINQPLAAVVASGHACLRFLTAQPSNVAGAREAAESIVHDAKDAGEVVRRIRALFRRAAVDKTLVSLNDVIGEVLHLLSGELAKRRVLVETDLANELSCVPGDRVQLQQLILNLIMNGMEAMDSVYDRRRELFIRSVHASPESVFVSVRDQGTGLDDPDKVFEAFVTTKENGMGMGLTICRSIVEAHAGRLWVAEARGPGATFCFELPSKRGPFDS